ncbi:MAG TPA: HD domain-containing protein [Clostridia bacterium]|nr:HD domain-containing protein [Clostridia bacterium]
MEKTGIIEKALKLAVAAHEGQKRKGSETPYIVHPVEVGLILIGNGASEEMVAAGILHDTLEDTEVEEKTIKKEFGKKVLEYVIGASEVLENRENSPWKARKDHTVRFLADAKMEIKTISCADKLSNIRSMERDNPKRNKSFWNRFNAGYEDQKWYYKSLVESLSDLQGTPMYEEFKERVCFVFGD